MPKLMLKMKYILNCTQYTVVVVVVMVGRRGRRCWWFADIPQGREGGIANAPPESGEGRYANSHYLRNTSHNKMLKEFEPCKTCLPCSK